MSKLNVLILYSCSEYPFRKTFKAFLDSFKKYTDWEITYINFPFLIPKSLLKRTKWDLIIYTHSFTAPWNRDNYKEKIKTLKRLDIEAQHSIAFFQDEYINTDLTNLFIEELRINKVFTVVPESEWSKVYPKVSKENIRQYLTGYIEEDDIILANKLLEQTKKDIDISYRTAYPGRAMANLGEIGWLKYAIALFGQKLGFKNSDIQVGTGFVTGDDWYKLLARSRYTLGVPSGANILDVDGSISQKLSQFQFQTLEDLRKIYHENQIPNDYQLEVVSPRLFEAGFLHCCQILVEGEYNGIFEKYKHYIPVKRDLSNQSEVIELIADSNNAKKIVQNVLDDIVMNPKYRYEGFVKMVFSEVQMKPLHHGRIKYFLTKLIAYAIFRFYSYISPKIKRAK